MSTETKSNILNHISDSAKTVIVERSPNSTLPTNIKTAQDVFDYLAPHAFINPGLPKSSTTVFGVIKVASEKDALAGTDNTTAITPYLLNLRLNRPEATTTVFGVTKYATNAEALAGTLSTKTITASALKYVLDTRKATESVQGTAKVSSLVMAVAGTDDTTIMTPKKVAHAISMLSPIEGLATEKSKGVVILSTVSQAQQGEAREGLAISPYTFYNSRASITKVGTVKMSSDDEFRKGLLDSVSISPKILFNNKASLSTYGIVKLSNTKTNDKNSALAASAPVLMTTGGDTSGRITLNGKKYITEDEIGNSGLEVGMITMSTVLPKGGSDYVYCDGRGISRNTYQELFNLIGYTYGGSGDTFNVPDMRGLFVRGVGRGSNITGPLSNGVSGGSVGSIQQQQVAPHKHAGFGTAGHNDYEPPFGLSSNKRWKGASNSHHGSRAYYTNNGTEDLSGNEWPINPNGIVGNENRPWNISLYFVIKVK